MSRYRQPASASFDALAILCDLVAVRNLPGLVVVLSVLAACGSAPAAPASRSLPPGVTQQCFDAVRVWSQEAYRLSDEMDGPARALLGHPPDPTRLQSLAVRTNAACPPDVVASSDSPVSAVKDFDKFLGSCRERLKAKCAADVLESFASAGASVIRYAVTDTDVRAGVPPRPPKL